MTREEIRTRALRALNDDPVSPVFWSSAEANQLLEEAQEVLAEEVEALTRVLYIPQRAGCMFYALEALQARLMTPWRLWTRRRQHRLWPTSLTELDGHYERWLTVTGEPEWWFLLSWDCLGVWPAPQAGGGLMELDCFVWPTPPSNDSDEPETPDPDHDVLVSYIEMEGHVKQWDVSRALELGLEVLASARDARARSGLRAIQERFFTRLS